MTDEEFNQLEAEELAKLPEEFRKEVSWMCYERGHAYGHAEVLCHVKNMVGWLAFCVEKYKNRLTGHL